MDLRDNYYWWIIAAGAACTVLISALADQRRQKRVRVENVGFMPWTGITLIAVMIALMATAMAIKTGQP
jgi:hypothetical protein